MRYLSVCSGIEAATAAWHPLGFESAAFAEIEKAPSAVLAHHYPTVPNVGDFTKIEGTEHGSIDLLVGGTPCQSFSIAGLRGGLSDERGNLALEFIKLAYRSNSRWFLWENVPGVLSSSKGADFRAFLHGLTGVDLPIPQKGWKNSGLIVGLDGHFSIAWRVLDAQYFGVPQRRRRVFVVGHLGDWRRAASVLFERESLRWHPAPSRKEMQGASKGFTPSSHGSYAEGHGTLRANGGDIGGGSEMLIASTGNTSHRLNAGGMGRIDYETETFVVHQTSPAYGLDSQLNGEVERVGPLTIGSRSGSGQPARVAYATRDVASSLTSNYGKQPDNSDTGLGPNLAVQNMAVRRLTPVECSRLQGFPDDYLELTYGNATEAHTAQVLHELWREVGTYAREGWRSGIITTLLTPEILLTGVHVGWVSWEMAAKCASARRSLSSEIPWPKGFVQSLWINAEHRPSPYQRESFGQLARELGRPLSELPLERAQAAEVLLRSGVWAQAQEKWPLRYALAKTKAGKVMRDADGPRYKMLGNSMAVPCMAWIGRRIQQVDGIKE